MSPENQISQEFPEISTVTESMLSLWKQLPFPQYKLHYIVYKITPV